MAKQNVTLNGNTQNQETKIPEKERRVKEVTLEGWLRYLASSDDAPDIKVSKLTLSIAWVLGKDSAIAREIIERRLI